MQKLAFAAVLVAVAAAQFYGGYDQQQLYPSPAMPMGAAVDPAYQQQLGMAMQADPYAAMYPQYYPQQPMMQFAEVPYPVAAPLAEEESEEEAEEAQESEEEAQEESEEGEDALEAESFAETGVAKAKKAGKKAGASKKAAAAAKKGKKAAGKGKKAAGKGKKAAGKGKKMVKPVIEGKKAAAGKKGAKGGKKSFKPKPVGKADTAKAAPATKTPKAAGGKPLKPLPAPLPIKKKADCKKDPKKCLEAETPPEGHQPGDHSPTAIFKKKLENIKKSLMTNNRGIAQETKWIDEVEHIMADYAKKVAKVKEHIADERKAIKELLRQRRVALNEKQQKELELKLKMASNELTSLTEALKQVQKKESELGKGKSTLKDKIKQLTADLNKLKGNNDMDKKSLLKK